MSDSLWPQGLQHARLLCPSLPPWVCANSCPLSQWCQPTILSSVAPFSSCSQSFPTSESFPGGQSIGALASASVLPMNIQCWVPLGLIGLIYLLFKGLSSVFSSTTIQKHQFFGVQPFMVQFINTERFTLVRMVITKQSTNNKCWKRCGKEGTLLHHWWECKLVQPLWRTIWRLLKKLKIVSTWPSNPTSGFVSRQNYNLKRCLHPNIHSSTIYNSQEHGSNVI